MNTSPLFCRGIVLFFIKSLLLGLMMSRQGKPRQHLCYVYASLSRLDFRGLLEKGIVVFEGLTGFLAVKKPAALMMHWWNGGRGGVWTGHPTPGKANIGEGESARMRLSDRSLTTAHLPCLTISFDHRVGH